MTGERAKRPSAGHGHDYDGLRLELDVVGLAAAFGDYASRHRVLPGRRREALGAWLDELVAGLDRDPDASAPDAGAHDDG